MAENAQDGRNENVCGRCLGANVHRDVWDNSQEVMEDVQGADVSEGKTDRLSLTLTQRAMITLASKMTKN